MQSPLSIFVNQKSLARLIEKLENEKRVLKSLVHDEVDKSLRSKLTKSQYLDFVASCSLEIQSIEDNLYRAYSSKIEHRLNNLLTLKKPSFLHP